MARLLRIEYLGAVYHVTGRGNDKKAIFPAEAIEQRGYTQGGIADHLGLHVTSISRVLRTRAETPKE